MQAFVSTQLAGIGSWLGSMFSGLIESLLSIIITPIAMLLYSLQIGFFWLIDCVQGIFRSMAGLDLYYYQGEEQTGDMVLAMIMSDTVMSIFWGVLIVAIMLLFVTTFVAIIRSEFVERGANPKGPIIGRSIKALFYFAAVPIVCIFGIWIANIFLKSLDEATSNQSSALSTTVFFAASHDANRCRTDYDFAMSVKNSEIGEYLGLQGTNVTQEEIAQAIDEAFLQNLETPGDHTFNISGDHMWTIDIIKDLNNYYSETFNIESFTFTYYFYDLFLGYNYLIGFMGGFVAASLLLSSCIGIIQRLFELSILFIISPTVIAFMPIDDGKKYGQWRGEFIQRVGSMYGPVIGLNLLFMLLAAMRDIDIFPDTGIYAVFNSIVQLIFLIVGLLAVKDFSALISRVAGTGDVMKEGEGKKEGVQKMVGRVGAGTINAARVGSQFTKAVGSSILSRGSAATKSEISRLADEKSRYKKLGSTGYFQDALKSIDNGDFYKVQNKDGSYKYKRKVNGEMEKGGIELTEAERTTGRAKTIQNLATQMKADEEQFDKKGFDKRKANIDKYGRNSLQSQLIQYTSGQGYKTGLGTAFDAFLKAGGKDVGMLGRESVAERAKSGESIFGALPIFQGKDAEGNPIITRGNITTHDALYKTTKESKDAKEDARDRRISELQTEEKYVKDKEGNLIAGGTLKQGNEPLRVEVVRDQTGKDNPNNTGIDSSVISSLNNAMSNLTPALGQMSASANAMSKMNDAMNKASSDIQSAAKNLEDVIMKFKNP